MTEFNEIHTTWALDVSVYQSATKVRALSPDSAPRQLRGNSRLESDNRKSLQIRMGGGFHISQALAPNKTQNELEWAGQKERGAR
jgi:hypothetical protein